jgi:hypothetical protein
LYLAAKNGTPLAHLPIDRTHRRNDSTVTRPRLSRFRRSTRDSIGLALSLVVFMSASDVHGSSLNHSTFETPTPILWTENPHSFDDHMEPGSALLSPAHEPMLLKTARPFIRWLQPTGALAPPEHSGHGVPNQQGDLAPQYLQQPSPARAPPVA